MSKIRVGLNGFGRIGRAIFRISNHNNEFDIVAINDINPDIKNIAYLLQYDTTYGRFEKKVGNDDQHLLIENDSIPVYKKEKIVDVPWDEHEVDIVIDASGVKSNLDSLHDNKLKVKNVIVTNSPESYNDIQTIVFGVNESDCDPLKYKVFSSSICDTISLSPLIKIICETHGIESGFLTTLHPWLSYQNLLDGPSVSWSQPGDINSHYALGRASTQHLIPKSTSAIRAAESVLPGLMEKVQSFSYRTPTAIVSSAVLILYLDSNISHDQLVNKFYNFEQKQNLPIIRNTLEPLISIDYMGDIHSVIIDQRWTKVEKKRHVKLVYWYDNEWGYSSRVVDLIKKIALSYN